MKMTRTKQILALAALLANGWFAAAQSNNAPGPQDYAKFSAFVTDRNIFDPNRVPHNYTGQPRTRIRTTRSAPVPTCTLVGTMAYEKGLFAFFSGTSSELRKVLYPAGQDTIAGFTVAEVTQAGVKLRSADKRETVSLKIGDAMRQEGNTWRPSVAGETTTASTTASESESSPAADSSSPDANAPAASAAEPNDVLKRLMQQREQELK